MVVLKLGLAVAAIATYLSGCYSPDLVDCTVTCSAVSDCADHQRCQGGFCVAEDKMCSGGDDDPVPEKPDARPVTPPVDAPPAPPTTTIHVMVMGGGGSSVVVADKPACTSDCMVVVPRGVQIVITAVESGKHFEKWTSLACAGQDETCTLTPAIPLIDVTAKFH